MTFFVAPPSSEMSVTVRMRGVYYRYNEAAQTYARTQSRFWMGHFPKAATNVAAAMLTTDSNANLNADSNADSNCVQMF